MADRTRDAIFWNRACVYHTILTLTFECGRFRVSRVDSHRVYKPPWRGGRDAHGTRHDNTRWCVESGASAACIY